MRKRPALITASESISTLRANWPGSERPAAGQRLGHLMAVIWGLLLLSPEFSPV